MTTQTISIDAAIPSSRLSNSDVDDLYQVKGVGIEMGWQVIRKADGAVMQTGLKDADAAMQARRYIHGVEIGRA